MQGSARVYAVATCLLLGAFVAFSAATGGEGGAALNRELARLARLVAGGALQPLYAPADTIGSPTVSGILALLLAGWLATRHGLAAGAAAFALFLAMSAIEGAMRVRFDRLPWEHLAAFVRNPHGWHLVHSTYPSGHTARLALLAGIAAATVIDRRLLAWIAASAAASWVALQRVESGAHTGADVVGAILLAFGLACLYGATLPWLASVQEGFIRGRSSRSRAALSRK